MKLLFQALLIFLTIMLVVLGAEFAAQALTPFGADMLTQGVGGSGVGGGGPCIVSINFTQSCSIILWGSLL